MHHELSLWIKKILLLLLLAAWVWILYILSVIGVYVTIFLLWSIVIWTLIPIVIDYVIDTTSLVINWVTVAQKTYLEQGIVGFHFHPYIEKIIIFVFWEGNIGHTLDIIKQNAGSIQSIITTQIWSLTSGGLSIVSAVGWVVANWALVGITTFLMILERKEIGQFIIDISPKGIDRYMKAHYLYRKYVMLGFELPLYFHSLYLLQHILDFLLLNILLTLVHERLLLLPWLVVLWNLFPM